MRTAPWCEDMWEHTISSDSSLQDDPQHSSDEGDTTSVDTWTPSTPCPREARPCREIRIQPGHVHLLMPNVHRIGPDAIVSDPGVDTPYAVRLRGCDADWYERTVKFGIRLPRPAGAPAVFRITKPSATMNRVVTAWKGAGLLVQNPQLKFAMPMFLVP